MPVTRRLLIFCRRPELGRVKTRLEPVLGRSGALALHETLIRNTLEQLRNVPDCQVDLVVTDADDDLFRWAQLEYGVALVSQVAGDLGVRMAHAAAVALERASAVVLVGSDCPAICADYVSRALDGLEQGHDLVLGPAEDGGYVLIGLKRPLPMLFEEMPWGTADVLAETRRRVRMHGLECIELERLWDVDRPQDLERLWLRYPQLQTLVQTRAREL